MQGQGHGWGQRLRSHNSPRIQPMYLLIASCQSNLRRRRLISIGIPIMNLRGLSDHLRFIMGMPIQIRRRHFSEKRPCKGNNSSIGRFFRPPIAEAEENGGPSASGRHLGWPHFRFPQMRSSKMATGSGRAAIFLRLRNRGRKTRPRSWMTSFPPQPSWIQDGDGGNDVWRTSRRPWRRSTDVCPIHESFRSLTLLRFKKHLIVSLTQALSKWLSELPACYYAEVISLHMSKVVKNLRLQQAPTLLFLDFILFF